MPKGRIASRLTGAGGPSVKAQSLLERRGYTLGGTLGVGAYAKVKAATQAATGKKVRDYTFVLYAAQQHFCQNPLY
jgi:hypothetical protein